MSPASPERTISDVVARLSTRLRYQFVPSISRRIDVASRSALLTREQIDRAAAAYRTDPHGWISKTWPWFAWMEGHDREVARVVADIFHEDIPPRAAVERFLSRGGALPAFLEAEAIFEDFGRWCGVAEALFAGHVSSERAQTAVRAGASAFLGSFEEDEVRQIGLETALRFCDAFRDGRAEFWEVADRLRDVVDARHRFILANEGSDSRRYDAAVRDHDATVREYRAMVPGAAQINGVGTLEWSPHCPRELKEPNPLRAFEHSLAFLLSMAKHPSAEVAWFVRNVGRHGAAGKRGRNWVRMTTERVWRSLGGRSSHAAGQVA